MMNRVVCLLRPAWLHFEHSSDFCRCGNPHVSAVAVLVHSGEKPTPGFLPVGIFFTLFFFFLDLYCKLSVYLLCSKKTSRYDKNCNIWACNGKNQVPIALFFFYHLTIMLIYLLKPLICCDMKRIQKLSDKVTVSYFMSSLSDFFSLGLVSRTFHYLSYSCGDSIKCSCF